MFLLQLEEQHFTILVFDIDILKNTIGYMYVETDIPKS